MKVYQVELSDADLKLINDALGAYENQPGMTGLMTNMLSSIFGMTPGRTSEEKTQSIREEQAKAEAEVAQRKRITSRLRLKLLDMQERPSEFSTERTS